MNRLSRGFLLLSKTGNVLDSEKSQHHTPASQTEEESRQTNSVADHKGMNLNETRKNIIFMKPNSFYGNSIHSMKSNAVSHKRLAELPQETNLEKCKRYIDDTRFAKRKLFESGKNTEVGLTRHDKENAKPNNNVKKIGSTPKYTAYHQNNTKQNKASNTSMPSAASTSQKQQASIQTSTKELTPEVYSELAHLQNNDIENILNITGSSYPQSSGMEDILSFLENDQHNEISPVSDLSLHDDISDLLHSANAILYRDENQPIEYFNNPNYQTTCLPSFTKSSPAVQCDVSNNNENRLQSVTVEATVTNDQNNTDIYLPESVQNLIVMQKTCDDNESRRAVLAVPARNIDQSVDFVELCIINGCGEDIFTQCSMCGAPLCDDHGQDACNHDTTRRVLYRPRNPEICPPNEVISCLADNIVVPSPLPTASMSTSNQATSAVLQTTPTSLTGQAAMPSCTYNSTHASDINLHSSIPAQERRTKSGARLKRLNNKNNRLLGKSYETKTQQNTAARKVKQRCNHIIAKSTRSFHCYEVCDKMRDKVWTDFWHLSSWDAKKASIRSKITMRQPHCRRKVATVSTAEKPRSKEMSYDYFLPTESGDIVKVCRKFFMNTLDVGNKQLYLWLSADKALIKKRIIETDHAANAGKRKNVAQWLQQLPKVPSHYCRANTSRLYVESSFQSKSHMHRVYTAYSRNQGFAPVSRQVFTDILEENRVSIHKPRKDQCDLCCANDVGSVSSDDYEEHIIKKIEAELAKGEAKKMCNDQTAVITMDVQSVLLAPKLLASAIYYKRKLQVHNMTFFRLNDSEVQLYVWNESDGGVSCNEFTSCVVHYISALPATVNRVILISDGCAYQNRNRVLASALRDISKSQNKVIEQLFLERGHTMMEADSVHAQLGRVFKSAVVYAPSNYVCLMAQARPEQPYHVQVLDHTFFMKYDVLPSNATTIRPSNGATVNEIRALKFDDGEISYKLRHPDQWSFMVTRVVPTRGVTRMSTPLSPMYTTPPKISRDKYNHLQELKILLPNEYHAFYDSLEHE